MEGMDMQYTVMERCNSGSTRGSRRSGEKAGTWVREDIGEGRLPSLRLTTTTTFNGNFGSVE